MNAKTRAAIIILALILVVFSFTCIILGNMLKKREAALSAVNETSLRSFSYTLSGGMNGEYYSVDLRCDDEDRSMVTVEIHDQMSHDSRDKKVKKRVNAQCCSDIDKIINENGVLAWAELPESGITVTDISEFSVSISRFDGQNYRISQSQQLPDNSFEVINEILSIIRSYAGIE